MDNYFTRKLVPFLKRKSPSKHLVKLLADAGLDTEEALIMMGMDRPYRRIRTLIRIHLTRYTTQHFEKIDELFACIGIKDLSKHAERKTGRKQLLASIRLLVKRRHEIAHEGDLNDHGSLQAIDAKRTVKRIRDLRLFVATADEIIESTVRPKKKANSNPAGA